MAFDLACRFVLTVVLSNNKRTIVLIVAYSIDTTCRRSATDDDDDVAVAVEVDLPFVSCLFPSSFSFWRSKVGKRERKRESYPTPP